MAGGLDFGDMFKNFGRDILIAILVFLIIGGGIGFGVAYLIFETN